MRYKAVIFDLFETLITEWGHEKYTKRKMCADLGVEMEQFAGFWEAQGAERYLGNVSFAQSLTVACLKCGKTVDQDLLCKVIDKRTRTKAACFDFVMPEVFQLLEDLKARGMLLALCSNCSAEEVAGLRESALYRYFDAVVLSCEVHLKKPDCRIYEEAAMRLGITCRECIFVGDGGSDELAGAKAAGMEAVCAKWYTNLCPHGRGEIGGGWLPGYRQNY